MHLSRRRPADIFLHFLTNSSSMIIVFLGELSSAFGAEAGDPSFTTESIRTYLERYPESSLSNLLSAEKQHEKLQLMANDILKMFLDSELYKCELTKTFLLETLCNLVLGPLVESCSRPEYINGWIVYLLEEGEPELMNALDAGLEQANRGQSAPTRFSSQGGQGTIMGTSSTSTADRGHNSKKSKGAMEMEETMRQVQRLNDMIAAERKQRDPGTSQGPHGDPTHDWKAEASTVMEDLTTPSSDSEKIMGFHSNDLDRAPLKGSLELHRHGDIFTKSTADGSTLPISSQRSSLDKQGLENGQSTLAAPQTPRQAAVSVVDDFNTGEDRTFRSKPTKEYLLQIEPADLRHQGWMVARKYTDFETLHEVLARISWISGASSFRAQYPDLPTWKGRSKQSLQHELQQYLRHALRHDPLADSEAMKRFLDKSRGSDSSVSATGFGFPNSVVFGTVSKGVLGVLSNAPKGVAGGSKAVLNGVTGVFGTSSRKKSAGRANPAQGPTDKSRATNSNDGLFQTRSTETGDVSRTTPVATIGSSEICAETASTASDGSTSIVHSPTGGDLIPSARSTMCMDERNNDNKIVEDAGEPLSRLVLLDGDPEVPLSPASDLQAPMSPGGTNARGSDDTSVTSPDPLPGSSEHNPLSEDETAMAIELLFAMINEMYSLSSVWTIRKALLNATKAFLLRPGNPNIGYIGAIIQKAIDENTSDETLAGYINTLQRTCLGTDDNSTSGQLSDEEKVKLRQRARELFVANGIPRALASVMGTSATSEALGRVFDSFQDESICHGLVFVVILQALKVLVQ